MNVVTIDFDIIMKPSIEFYNDMISDEEPMKSYIEDFSFLANIPADLYIYDYLTRYIVRAAKNNTEIYFIDSHEKIVDIIKELPKDEAINLYNIDHHHDLGYELILWNTPLFNYDVGNWVKYLKDNRYINEYCWIHNENSDSFPKEAERYVNSESVLKNFNLDDEKNQPDILVLCSSFEWIPPVYQPLFYCWNNICSEIAGKEYSFDSIAKI